MGGIKAVIFDRSGTVVDFADHGVTIHDDEARGSMGLPRLAAAWRGVHGQDITTDDIDRLHGIFKGRIGDAALRRSVLTPLARLAAAQGFAAEVTVCPAGLAGGGPIPHDDRENGR